MPLAISKLLKLGAISSIDKNGHTPLELAQILGNEEAIIALRESI